MKIILEDGYHAGTCETDRGLPLKRIVFESWRAACPVKETYTLQGFDGETARYHAEEISICQSTSDYGSGKAPSLIELVK
jgi:hypothetical protein